MTKLDTHVVSYLKNKGRTQEGIFVLLVDMIAKEGNTLYVDHLLKVLRARDMLKLAIAIENWKS